MNALVKKEIRLLFPSWTVAMLLALVQGITRPYDFYAASLVFFGLTLMALTTIGREASLNTFSSLVALPAERIRIWTTKLSVLATAFLIVFLVWLAAFSLAILRSNLDVSGRQDSYNLFIAICLIATATFTGGLWTTLLLRQLAGSFWLTLLVPATLSGFSGIFLVDSESDSLVIAVLSVVIGVYSVAGFLFARWLFFRAQDVGWSGGVIALPEWKFLFARAAGAAAMRKRQPIFALFRKELQLQQGVLTGAVGLLVLHAGIVGFRVVHTFPRNSLGEGVGEILTSIVWVLWLVLPAILGSISVAEERKVGVMESQLCLPASRRLQFAVKAVATMGLGVFLGGVMPMLLETIGLALGSRNELFMTDHHPLDAAGLRNFLYGTMAFSAWVTLLGLFASSLAKNFLQAVSIALVAFVGFMFCIPALMSEPMTFLVSNASHSLLLLIVAIPTIVVALGWLAYLNYKNFREGWPLWRRNVLGLVGAFVCIVAASAAIYHRAWEVLEPVEPAHGPAKFSLANPPAIHNAFGSDDLLVQLPGGQVWCDRIGDKVPEGSLSGLIRRNLNPLPASIGPQHYVSGSNWVSFTVGHFITGTPDQAGSRVAYWTAVGIKADGTLWVSNKSGTPLATEDRMVQFGHETNWLDLSWPWPDRAVLLLKNDGTLWGWGTSWGTNRSDNPASPSHLTGLSDLNPYRIGTNSDWQKIAHNAPFLQKVDGSVWRVSENPKSGEVGILRSANWDQVEAEKIPPQIWGPLNVYVRKDGTLWNSETRQSKDSKLIFALKTTQVGKETNWISAVNLWQGTVVALKSDGTLWQRGLHRGEPWWSNALPTRLGIHHDWVALATVQNGVVALAADGSLWLWPGQGMANDPQLVMRLPKQPQFLGSVLREAKKI